MNIQRKNPLDLAEDVIGAGNAAIRDFLKLESAGGILIMLSALLAMLLANSPMGAGYEHFLHTKLSISFGEMGLSKTLHHWVNDGLMAVFFLLVGLEIKRELVEGELSSREKAILPFFAAIGGMAAPALIYAAINAGSPETLRGWAIPSATDIAFALGVLSLLGSRVPLSLKVFLTAVAVMDDLGAVVVIALFYTATISMTSLMIALVCLAILVTLNLRGARSLSPYIVVGVVMWLAVLESGVHATIAGVVLGFTIPLKPLKEGEGSLLKQMEHGLHAWVAYLILPLFAFANAGVDFDGITADKLQDPVPLGIAAGLFLGKQLGVFFASVLLIKLGIARMPEGVNWRQFYGICVMCGIGFTMSLFIGSLAFDSAVLMTETKLGVLLGSLASGVVGYLLLASSPRRSDTV